MGLRDLDDCLRDLTVHVRRIQAENRCLKGQLDTLGENGRLDTVDTLAVRGQVDTLEENGQVDTLGNKDKVVSILEQHGDDSAGHVNGNLVVPSFPQPDSGFTLAENGQVDAVDTLGLRGQVDTLEENRQVETPGNIDEVVSILEQHGDDRAGDVKFRPRRASTFSYEDSTRPRPLSAARLSQHGVTERNRNFAQTRVSISVLKELETELKQTCVQKGATSTGFVSVCNMAILASTIYAGLYTDIQLRDSFERVRSLQPHSVTDEATFSKVNLTFVVWFCLEISIRLAAERRAFFTGPDWAWNIFDFVIVFLELLDTMFEILPSGLFFLRVARVGRVIRVVRLVKQHHTLQKLRTMMMATIRSFTHLMWAFVLIGMAVYIVSIFLGSAIVSFLGSVDVADTAQINGAMDMETHFGTLWTLMVAMFASISGGNDWMTYGNFIRRLQYGDLWFAGFVFYVSFLSLGLLNVVTGIFCDSAAQCRTDDEMVTHYIDNTNQMIDELTRIFGSVEREEEDYITKRELKQLLTDNWVQAYFAGIEIDPREPTIMFTLMDGDRSGKLHLSEFIKGILKMKGSAKSLDLLTLMYDHAHLQIDFSSFSRFVERELGQLKEIVLSSQLSL
eukprot:TRINITY_DN13115_c0_g1_i1.p1 TRINITY_DN13115_c0_g1~~TRINITY_DN13115_c0_g1_i1.p1  ORF type:complete len:633 (+),score=91.55 TRINITY_DN13115_c0_g1_i1:44-1900(+)